MNLRRLPLLWLAVHLLAAAGHSNPVYTVEDGYVVIRPSPTYRPAEAPPPAAIDATQAVIYADPAWSQPDLPFTFSVGTRTLLVTLLNAKKGRPFDGSFVGSITKLEPNQNLLPLRPYAQITAQPGPIEFGIGISYDALDVSTVDGGGGDGDVEMSGALIYFVASMPTETPFTPFGELGKACYRNRFDPIPSWSAGGMRAFHLDNSVAFYLGAGCDVRLADRWSANLYARYVNVDVDGKYVHRYKAETEPFTFTLEHLAFGLGVKYSF